MANFFNLDGANNKTIILTTHTKNYDFFDLQVKQLAKHVKFPYIFVAGVHSGESSDSISLNEREIKVQFEAVSVNTKTSLIQIPSVIHQHRSIIFPDIKSRKFRHGPADLAANNLQYLLSVIPWWQFKNLLVIDGDMFPIADIQAPLVSESNIFRGVLQIRKFFTRTIKYFWSGYFWIHNSCPFHYLLNFQNGFQKTINTDVGGRTSYFLNALLFFDYPFSYAEHLSSGNWGNSELESLSTSEPLKKFIQSDARNPSSKRFYTELYDNVFFHYRAGSNWTNNNILDEENRRDALRQSFI